MGIMDVTAIQRRARMLKTAPQLFQLWDAVCKLYDRGRLSVYELDEVQLTICARLRRLDKNSEQSTKSAA